MKRFIFSTLTLCLAAVSAFSQQLPIDPQTRVGVLDNGLTYYIRHNEQPKERAEFHIAQAVGAILEEDNQNGLAHFLEHMAFNGTKHYPGKDIINYFESIGVDFGGNINAYTSLDETVYRLSNVPTVREGVIDSALLVLFDWSCGLLLEGDEIDSERGVIREEWRTGADASRRMWKRSNELKYAGSQYAKRDVIGDTAVINNFEYEALRSYYKKWYGPDLQAIIVVGDVDVDAVEAKIKALWNEAPARENRGERPVYTLPNNEEPIVVIVTDKEAQQTRITLEIKHEATPKEARYLTSAYEKIVCDNLISTILSYRFSELQRDPNASFVASYAAYGDLNKGADCFLTIFIPKDGREKDALHDLLTEVEKMRRYGFTNSEVELAKTVMLQSIEKQYNERNNRKNIQLTREFIRHYLDQTPVPGVEWEYEISKQLLPAITTEMLNEIAKNYVTDNNVIVAFTSPEKESVVLPTKEEVLATIAEVKNAEIEAPKEDVLDKVLVKNAPKKGKIKSEKHNDSLGTTEWTLSNGVKVVIKPTTFKNDEILFSAHSQGGLSKVKNVADLPSAILATDIVDNSGLGDFNATELEKYLAGKKVSISPYLSDYAEEISGNSTVKDLETLLQLNYLYFTAPRFDGDAFKARIAMYETVFVNKESSPEDIFGDSIQMTVSNHHPRTILYNMENLKKVDHKKAFEIFKERFANAADFTFMFTGNIDPNDAATRDLICQWLGGLKTKKCTETFVDHGQRYPEGTVKNYFNREMETKTASNRIVYCGKMDYTLQNRVTMSILGRILWNRYFEAVREREGGTYGVGVRGMALKTPFNYAMLLMQFDTDPEKQEKLMSIIHQEVQTIIENGPLAKDLNDTKSNYLKDFAEELEQNSWWHKTALYNFYINNQNYVENFRAAVENVTPELVQQTLKSLVEQNNVIEVVMMPE